MRKCVVTSREKHVGFTIVELLVVVVVIALLAAISVAAYTGVQNRAYDASVEADISALSRKMEMAKIDLGHYPSGGEFPDGFKFTKDAYNTTRNNVYYCLDRDNDRYSFGLISKSNRGYFLTDGVVRRDVAVASNANCNAISDTVLASSNRYVIQGHMSTAGTTYWNSGWSWTN